MTKQFVALSGGIDSTALALLCPEATPIFTDTKWEFPELYHHLRLFEDTTGREITRLVHKRFTGGIPEYIIHSMFLPGHSARWCTVRFKIEVANEFLKQNTPCELLIGLRSDEEERVGNFSNIDGLTIRYPLRERGFKRLDCITLCMNSGLLPRYPIYMARGGCIGCFYKRKSEVQAMSVLVPGILDRLQEMEEYVQDERGKFAFMFPNCGMSIRDIRRQAPLLNMDDVYKQASDKSDMGVACGLFCNR